MIRIALVISFLSICTVLNAGQMYYQRTLSWRSPEMVRMDQDLSVLRVGFDGARFEDECLGIPIFTEIFSLPPGASDFKAEIRNEVYDIAPDEFGLLDCTGKVKPNLELVTLLSYDRKLPVAQCSFIPVRINPYNGQYEILLSFDLVITPSVNIASGPVKNTYVQNSILSTGEWYKISVNQDGIHRISYNDLQQMGVNPGAINPKNIRLYGNGGGMLPESLSEFRHADLAENRIFVAGETDGSFDQQDYILFYGESPHTWKYQSFSLAFNHGQNIYSDSTYYFLNFDLGPGRRIAEVPYLNEPPDIYVNKFVDHVYHELDLHNLSNIGRVWYGEVFDVNTTYNFNYSFPGLDVESPAYFRAYVAAKSEVTTTFRFSESDKDIMTANISGIPSSANTYARPYVSNVSFSPSSESIKIGITYQKNISSSVGWLNFFELNVTRNLNFYGPQMSFRDPLSVSQGNIVEFSLGNAGPEVQIWNVTDPTDVHSIGTVQSGGGKNFRISHDTLAEFISFDGSSYLPVSFVEKVPNQDLHASGVHDMIIITHPLFREQAERLASFHNSHDGMSVLVAEIEKVYNEFSSGAQDVTAIRNFMKYLYDDAPAGEGPRYLLLFGDASFDYKDRIENNSNFVPTWEEEESLIMVYSIASDDYYGFLDGPGDNLLDIGIGRLPVQTVEQAVKAVDKIIHYATNADAVMRDWRNVLCFVADDEDGNQHLRQAEEMAAYLDTNYGVYNIDKIYLDAFPQISTPGGQRAPDVNNAINNRIDKGCLIMNYTGHGGEVGWGHERFLENSDIESWTNYDHMPILITATCEFSRYDDPERTSSGEYTFLNPNGGAIAMFTTARATFGGSNFNFNMALLEHMFEENGGEYYRFGDLIRLAKNNGGVDGNDKKYILLGDPALHLAYPLNEVVTTRINGEDVSFSPDTLQALKKITVEGEVRKSLTGGEPFNGTIFPIVYDKPASITTLAADPTSYQTSFEIQNNILYKGKAQATDGKFSFTFIVPKDIAYQYGFGKISYYASSESEDAHGYYSNVIVGGLDQSASPDVDGPLVDLYMNNEYFVNGGITDENPDMLAFVSDFSGINTVGTGIGHDLTAILDGNTDKPVILNEFYESDLDSYTSGTIRYPFYELDEGMHTLSVKVWDVFNNSAEAYLEFLVISSGSFTISDLINYPNPFSYETNFVFSHNQAEGELDVRLNIYSLNGQLVREFKETIFPTGYRTEPIKWDGSDEGGVTLAKGLYIYKVFVTNDQGRTDELSGKLVIIK